MTAELDRLRGLADATPSALLWLTAFAIAGASHALPDALAGKIAPPFLIAALAWTLLRTRDRAEILGTIVAIGFLGKGIALVTPLSADLASLLLLPLALLLLASYDREASAARRLSPSASPPAL